MSDPNVDVVARGFAAIEREDWERVFADLDPDIEIEDRDIPDADEYRGRGGFLRWLENWNASWDAWRMEDVELRAAADDKVIALFRMIATGKGSGIEMERADAIVYVIRGGKIAKVTYFNDQTQALEAAGLAP